MRTNFNRNGGELSLIDQYNWAEYSFDFPLDSIIRWYPTNNNYSYQYSNKHDMIYLVRDTNTSKFIDYGISTMKANNFGKVVLNKNTWTCQTVFLDNLKLIDYFKNNYDIDLTGFNNLDELNSLVEKVLTNILKRSMALVHNYGRQFDDAEVSIEYYYEKAIKQANTDDQYQYYMLGKAYNLLMIYKKALL